MMATDIRLTETDMTTNPRNDRVRHGMDGVRVMVELAEKHGMSADECLAGSGLQRSALADPYGEILASQELSIIRKLLAHLGADRGLGLLAGVQMNLSMAGILGYAIVSSPTVRSAMQVIQRYLDLTYVYFPVFLEEDEREFRLVLDDSTAPADVRQFLLERVVGFVFANVSAIFGEIPRNIRVDFRGPRPAYAAQLESLNPITLAGNRARNLIAGDKALLDRAMPQANSLTQRLCEEQCRHLLMQRQIRSGRSEAVRGLCLKTPDRVPDIQAVARQLNTSSRHLRRQLKAEGTSYRELVNEVRRFLAEEFLQDGLTVEDVAERLGFSEASSFIRAFKGWTGHTPGQARGATAA